MKKLFILVPMLALMLFTSCDKNAEVKQFITDLSAAIDAKDKAAIAKMYPDAAKAELQTLKFNADSIEIAETDKPEVLNITLGNVKLVVEKAEDGTFTVKSSQGLFALPKEKVDFAKKTGMWEEGMDDAALAERLKDEDFQKYLVDKFIEYVAKHFKVSNTRIVKEGQFALDEYIWGITVANNTDFKIDAADYKIYVKTGYIYPGMNTEDYSTSTHQGQEIQPGGTITVNETTTGHGWVEKAYIDKTINDQEFFNKYFKATGNEYKEYIESKK